MKNIFAIFILLFTFSFGTVSAEDFDTRNSYAVIWHIETKDKELYKKYIADQASSLLNLWQKAIIENVYFNKDKSEEEAIMDGKSRVMFFIKADSEDAAKKILNEMPFVTKK